jgi:transposase
MYVHRPTKNIGKKSYQSILLAQSYREHGKVKRRTLANLTQWPAEMIANIEGLCKGGVVVSKDEFATGVGKCFGPLYVFKQLADRHHLTKALGDTKKARIALLMIIANIIEPTSKLGLVNWAKSHAVKEILGIEQADLKDVYKVCDWLADNQEEIEKNLFKLRGGKKGRCYLYDVTSSYFEGEKNALAAFGYNRDKKRGKRQLVYGMFTDEDGFPLTVKAFKGNTVDTIAFSEQIVEVQERFKIDKVAFVADRGAMKAEQMEKLQAAEIFHVTAMTKAQIQALIKEDVIQLGAFDTRIREIKHEGKRLILRRNPIRAEECKVNRQQRIATAMEKIQARAEKLKTSERGNPQKAYDNAVVVAHKLKVQGFLNIELSDRQLTAAIEEEAVKKAELLDGCYIVQTDAPRSEGTAREIHDRYKDLKYVESAWRKFKTGHLEVRPVYLQKEPRTRGHIFMTMLAYYLLRHFWIAVKDQPLMSDRIEESLRALKDIYTTRVKIQNLHFEMVPELLSELQTMVLSSLGLSLPHGRLLSSE